MTGAYHGNGRRSGVLTVKVTISRGYLISPVGKPIQHKLASESPALAFAHYGSAVELFTRTEPTYNGCPPGQP